MRTPNNSMALLFASVTFSVVGSAHAAPKLQPTPQVTRVARSRTANVQQYRQSAASELLNVAQRELQIRMRNNLANLRFRDAVQALGELRAEEATSFLASHITIEAFGVTTEVVPMSNYPCVLALIQIGNPSVQEILRRMKPLGEGAEYDQRDLHLFAYVIRQVDGDEVGLFRLQQAAKSAQGTHKLNLLNLIDIYKRNESEFDIRKFLLRDEGSSTITIPANPSDKRY